MGEGGAKSGGDVMDIKDVVDAIRWQADLASTSGAPITAKIVLAQLAMLESDSVTGRRMARWQGLPLEDAMPLRVAAGVHYLHLSGTAPELAPIYAGALTDQAAIDARIVAATAQFDHVMLPWLDHPPQTNEAGRSSLIMAGLAVAAQHLGPRFSLIEIGASAGINTMMGRYAYDLAGVRFGPSGSPVQLVPEWRGAPPPAPPIEIVGAKGCDVAPVDLTDPEAALRLKSYVWSDATERMARVEAAIALAGEEKPDLVQMDAAEFVRLSLVEPQETGVTRTLFHTIMWQYMPDETQAAITQAMEEAGAKATRGKPLAWVKLEVNRETYARELTLRFWPGGEEEMVLANAHPHGAWVEWQGA